LLLAPICIWRMSWNRLVLSLKVSWHLQLLCWQCAELQLSYMGTAMYTLSTKLNVAKTLAGSIVGACLDYCNYIIYGAPMSTILKLQCRKNLLLISSSRSPAADTITSWTSSMYSSLASRPTADSLQVGYNDIKARATSMSDYLRNLISSCNLGYQNVIAIGISYTTGSTIEVNGISKSSFQRRSAVATNACLVTRSLKLSNVEPG